MSKASVSITHPANSAQTLSSRPKERPTHHCAKEEESSKSEKDYEEIHCGVDRQDGESVGREGGTFGDVGWWEEEGRWG